jgi:hypothetical protein
VSRITALQWKVFDRLRHRDAFDLASRAATAADFASLRDSRQGLVVTWKKSLGPPIDGTARARRRPDRAEGPRVQGEGRGVAALSGLRADFYREP